MVWHSQLKAGMQFIQIIGKMTHWTLESLYTTVLTQTDHCLMSEHSGVKSIKAFLWQFCHFAHYLNKLHAGLTMRDCHSNSGGLESDVH